MNPKQLRSVLVEAASDLGRTGEATWQRAADWTKPGFPPSSGERGGGFGAGEPTDRISDRREDAAAARYHQELVVISDRVAKDLARIAIIQMICNPTQIVEPCAVCGDPIDTRPNGQRYYATKCRRCGSHSPSNL